MPGRDVLEWLITRLWQLILEAISRLDEEDQGDTTSERGTPVHAAESESQAINVIGSVDPADYIPNWDANAEWDYNESRDGNDLEEIGLSADEVTEELNRLEAEGILAPVSAEAESLQRGEGHVLTLGDTQSTHGHPNFQPDPAQQRLTPSQHARRQQERGPCWGEQRRHDESEFNHQHPGQQAHQQHLQQRGCGGCVPGEVPRGPPGFPGGSHACHGRVDPHHVPAYIPPQRRHHGPVEERPPTYSEATGHGVQERLWGFLI